MWLGNESMGAMRVYPHSYIELKRKRTRQNGAGFGPGLDCNIHQTSSRRRNCDRRPGPTRLGDWPHQSR